jgi:hypothetical protein
MRRQLITLVGIGVLLFGTRGSAHHAFAAEFDSQKPVNLVGTVTEMKWVSPHSFMYVDVKDPKTGEVQNWACEMAAPNTLVRRGVNRTTVKIGAQVKVDGYQSKDGRPSMTSTDVTFQDGTKIFLGSEGTGAPGTQAPTPK